MSNSYDFTVVQDINFTVILTAQNSDLSYINLSGYGLTGYVRSSYGNTGILYGLNVTPNTNYSSGLLYVSGRYPQSKPMGQFVYDILGVNSNGYTIRLLNGNFTVSPVVTY